MAGLLGQALDVHSEKDAPPRADEIVPDISLLLERKLIPLLHLKVEFTTGVREMFGNSDLLRWRDEIAKGPLTGPRVISERGLEAYEMGYDIRVQIST